MTDNNTKPIHYRLLYDDQDKLAAHELNGRDVTVVIASVGKGKVGWGKKASTKPILSFVGAKKSWAAPKTCSKVIAALYGTDTRAWIGKSITLYPTTTSVTNDETKEREVVECIRVRPVKPEPRGQAVNNGTDEAAPIGPDVIRAALGADEDKQ